MPRLTELEEWKQAASVEAQLRREFQDKLSAESNRSDRIYDALSGLVDWCKEGCPDGGAFALQEAQEALASKKMLPEDADERRMFDQMAEANGGPLKAVSVSLTVWSRTLPQEGSMAKICAIMANEVRRATESN